MAPLRCAKVRELLCAYIDGELDPRARLAVQRHLEGCGSCAAEVAGLKATVALVQALPRAKLPPDFHAALTEKIKAESAAIRADYARRAGSVSDGWSGFWRSLGSTVRQWRLRTVAVVAVLAVVLIWAGAFAYFMGVPGLGGDLLGLRGKPPTESEGPGGFEGAKKIPPGIDAGGESAPAGPSETPRMGATEPMTVEGGASVAGDTPGALDAQTTYRALALQGQAGRKVILNVGLTLNCADVGAARDRAVAAAEGAGGFVESLNYWTSGEGSNVANLVLRVPVDKLSTVLGSIRGLGELVGEQATRMDVTAQHIDTTARIDNLRKEELILLELLGRAESLGDVFAIQSELTRVRTDIEIYEASLRSLDEQIAYSTINLTLQPAGTGPSPKAGLWERITSAFLKSVSWMGHLAERLVVFLARLVPVLAVVALGLWIVLGVRARRRKVGM